MTESNDWIELTEGKQFSRLLYTNPVCFLCTSGCSAVDDGDDEAKSLSTTNLPTMSNIDIPNEAAAVTRPTASQNVMVLSWLTATNNNGRFMFSLNRRRHSSTLLKGSSSSSSSSSEFTLSVPVQGMEDLVRSVGSVSGYFGSKFPADYNDVVTVVGSSSTFASDSTTSRMSKRQRKKEPRFPTGIPQLERVNIGDSERTASSSSSNHGNTASTNDHCFAIQGTVAQLVCRVYRIMPSSSSSSPSGSDLNETSSTQTGSIIDDDHDLILAEVVRARVRPAYFDISKNLFRPATPDTPPYLTFFGSQTFGYVVSQVNT
jgi:flavin reductase (DIM6/NTAB) family NADH-FMN oxidoreductase RutF